MMFSLFSVITVEKLATSLHELADDVATGRVEITDVDVRMPVAPEVEHRLSLKFVKTGT